MRKPFSCWRFKNGLFWIIAKALIAGGNARQSGSGVVWYGETNVGVKDGCNTMDRLKDTQKGAGSYLPRVNCFEE